MRTISASELQPVPTVRAPAGMVCAVDHLAAQAGLAALQAGGSAADAAVAASAVLAVTCQHMCGMGGDLLAVVAAPGGPPEALESAGWAGAGADPERLRAEGHREMPGRGDVRSVTVPGCVDGWLALHGRHGRLPLEGVLAPARRYAEEGFPASPALAAAAADVAHLPGAADFAPARPGRPLQPGDRVRRPGAGRALAAVAAAGRAGFYGGEFGEGLLALGQGYFADSDLAAPVARWRPAVAADAWGRRLWTCPPPSQGYLALAGAWIASGLDLPKDPADPLWPHLLAESARQAARDRTDVLHEDADGSALVAAERLAPRRALVSPDGVSPAAGAYRGGGTIALCAVDSERMGVSLVQSNAAGFGSHLVVPGVGIFLHNRGIGFSLVPGHPNEYRPGRRPAHTLSPLVVTEPGGRLAAVAGTMGADSQPQVLLQLAARVLAGGQEPAPAVAAGRWRLSGGGAGALSGFYTWAGGDVRVVVEGHAPPGWAAGLARRGHVVDHDEAWSPSFGLAHWISVGDDHLVGSSDPRSRVGAAAAW